MRALVLLAFLACSAVVADEPGYDLSLGAEVVNGVLRVAPTIVAPAGKALRYEVVTTRSGAAGKSESRQGGNVTVGANGKASLSQMTVSVGEQDRYEVSVQIFDGSRRVAGKTLKHPQ